MNYIRLALLFGTTRAQDMFLQPLEEPETNVDDGSGTVTFSQCDDDFGDFTLDKSHTKVIPNPVTKGERLNFIIEGILNDPIHVDDVIVHVMW